MITISKNFLSSSSGLGTLVNIIELIFTYISLLIYTDALLILVLSGGAGQSDVVSYNTSVYHVCFLIIYGTTLFFLAIRWKHVLYVVKKNKSFLLILLLAIFSVLWSEKRDATAIASIRLVGTSMFGLHLAVRYSLKNQVNLLAQMFGWASILSILFAILLPKYGIMGEGMWRGIYTHKNGLGYIMVQAVSAFLITRKLKDKAKISNLYIVISISLIVLSDSATSLVGIVYLLVLLLVIQPFRLSYRSMIFSLASTSTILFLLFISLIANAKAIAEFLGRDLTFTGRTDIWIAVWDMIMNRPWLGYGFSGFWHGLDGPSHYVWTRTGWPMTHSHNGFMELWINLGLIGLLIFIFVYLRNIRDSLKLIRLSSSFTSFFPILSLGLIFMQNLTESPLKNSQFCWMIFTCLSFTLPKELASSKTDLIARR